MNTPAPAAIDPVALTQYLQHHVTGFHGPVTLEKFAGGQSNPTFLLRAASGSYVLRRQPHGTLLKSAHAIDREFRVMSALAATPVPVARAVHLCTDRTVIGSMFYLMSYETGRIFWDATLPELPKTERMPIYHAMVDTLAALHEVDVNQVGLGDFGRSGNYYERQITLWIKQYRAAETEPLAAMEQLINWLPAHCPADTDKPVLVHGDFRLDNMIFAANAPRVQAVLDWELSTLGNPLADLAYLCMCLRMPVGGVIAGLGGSNPADVGVPDEAALIARYCERRKLPPLQHWHFYMAFSYFRLAAIFQGIKRRALDGNASNARAMDMGNYTGTLTELGAALIE